ncbi:MAG: membrane protein insertion efficiency factor YidD [Clostridia bacterium]|nr:membrane protein insertion efficiency factor YidD [Clostridia bacterium]
MKKVLIAIGKGIIFIPKIIAIGLILIFKGCISPFIPHTCKFTPSCSSYARECFAEWGFFVAMWLTIKRLFRCHPFSKGGVDNVPINPKGFYKNIM